MPAVFKFNTSPQKQNPNSFLLMLENSPELHLEEYMCETASILEKDECAAQILNR